MARTGTEAIAPSRDPDQGGLPRSVCSEFIRMDSLLHCVLVIRFDWEKLEINHGFSLFFGYEDFDLSELTRMISAF
jgi:hypothetical protein